MRVVTRKIRDAWLAGKKRTIRNTETDGTSVWLFGNEIIRRNEYGETLIKHCGWHTQTTAERLRHIANAHVHIQNGIMHLDGEPWTCGDIHWYNYGRLKTD